jgi:hypothetical protein
MVACMAVMARETWTDERLDDLAKGMDKGFDETKLEIRDLRAHTDKGFDGVKGEIKDLRVEMNSRFSSVDARFDALQRTMVLGLVGMTVSIVASVIGGVFAVLMLG